MKFIKRNKPRVRDRGESTDESQSTTVSSEDSLPSAPIPNNNSGRRFPDRKVGAIVAGIIVFSVLAYAYANNMIAFNNTAFHLDRSHDDQDNAIIGSMRDDEDDLSMSTSVTNQSKQQELSDLKSPLGSVTSKISVMNAKTNKPLQKTWIYIDPKDFQCITGVEDTFCVNPNPDCITDEKGVCFVEMELGEHAVLVKTFIDNILTSSDKHAVSITSENNEVTLHVSRSFPVTFEIKNNDSGTLVDGAEIHVDGKLIGIANNGRSGERVEEGFHNVLVKYKNQFGQEVIKRIKVNVEEKLMNEFVITIPALTYKELRDHALTLINEERKRAGLSSVVLGINLAAQKHAEEMLHEGFVSNWNMQGLKPYMRYTSFGGMNAVSENVAFAYCDMTNDIRSRDCDLDPVRVIEKLYEDMMRNDAESNGVHRNNILNKWHNKVSIGIAYDNDGVALVQDFENEYIAWDKPITVTSSGMVEMSGKITVEDFKPVEIAVYRDKLPAELTPSLLSIHPYNSYYDNGELMEMIQGTSSRQYYNDPSSDTASRWFLYKMEGHEAFDISFSLASILKRQFTYSNDGIYTIYLIAENVKGERVLLTNYSLKYENRVLSSLDGSELWRCSNVPSHRC